MTSRKFLLSLLICVSISFAGIELQTSDIFGFSANIIRDKYPDSPTTIQRDDAFFTCFVVMPEFGVPNISITPTKQTPVNFVEIPQDIKAPSIKYIGKMRNVPVGLLYIPMYDTENSVRFEELTISVTFQTPLNTNEIFSDSPIFDNVLGNVFLNYITIPRVLPDCAGHYVIICPEFAQEAVQPLVELRRKMGYIVDFNLLEDITDSPTKDDINDFLKNKYETLEPTPDLVLLIGDEDFPEGGGLPDYSWIEPGRTPFASDNTYALFDDEDYIPDVLIGRLTIDTEVQLQTLLAKVIAYEKDPLNGGSQWLETGLMVASYLHATTPPMSALWVRELMMRSGYTDIDTLFDRLGMRITTEQVASAINEGISYIDYRGWGASTGWWEPEFMIPDVYDLDNSPHYPIVATVVCGTADFRSLTDPCFSEVLLHAGSPSNPKGASAVYGPSDHDTHTRYNNPVNTGFFEAPFGYNMSFIGQAALFSKFSIWLYLPHERDTTVAHYFYVYNTLADPAFNMWTAIPESLSLSAPDTLRRSGEVFTVNVSPAESGVRVCLYKHNDGLQIFGITDETGSAQLRLTGGTTSNATLTAWKNGYIAAEKNVYIQYYDHARLNILSVTIDDGDDGILNSGESATVNVEIENIGDSTPIEIFKLSSQHPEVLVTVPSDRVTVEGTFTLSFDIGMKVGAYFNDELKMSIAGINGEEERYLMEIEIPHDTGDLEVTDYAWTGTYEIGTNSYIEVDLTNNGSADFTYSTFYIYSECPYLKILTPSVWVEDLAIGSTTSLEFAVVPIGFLGVDASIRIETRNGDIVSTFQVDHETGGPSGPDLAGYFAFDRTDEDYPSDLEFYDISELGEALPMSDDRTTRIEIPFNFDFYGDTYTNLSICSNGWMAPGEASYFLIDFYNLPIPGSSGPFGVIAPYWNDLEPSLSAQPYVYTYYDDDNDRYIIQYHHFRNRNYTDDQYFQVQIFDYDIGDDPIAFLYEESLDNQTHNLYSTVGIAAPDRRRGLEYRYDNIYTYNSTPFNDDFGIFFTNQTGQAKLSGTVNPSDARVFVSGFEARKDADSYFFPLLPSGETVVQAKINGYFETHDTISLSEHEDATHNITMELIPPPVDVTWNNDGYVHWTAPSAPGRTIEGYVVYRSTLKGSDWIYHEYTEETSLDYSTGESTDHLGNNRNDWLNVTAIIDGQESFFGNEVTTGIDETGINLPNEKELLSLNPNPFNSSLEIALANGTYDIEILGNDGRIVKKFPNASGTIIWDAKDNPSGIYLVTISKGNQILKSKRALLIK